MTMRAPVMVSSLPRLLTCCDRKTSHQLLSLKVMLVLQLNPTENEGIAEQYVHDQLHFTES